MSFTNSPLVTYTKISPNKTINRNHKIDTICIHCMAGKLTVQQCGNVFANVSRKASSNYGIQDNNIALYVEEKDRSWCTSSAKVDNRAITIEVSNDGGSETGWHVSNDSLKTLIKLCADICKRNGIEKLIWSNNKKDRVNHNNGCNMEVHRDYANKSCPGNYLYGKMSYIAEQTNLLLGSSVNKEISNNAPLSCTATIKGIQEYLNKYYGTQIQSVIGSKITVDGSFSNNSKKALAIAFQTELIKLGSNINIDGSFGPSSEKAFNSYVGSIKTGSKGIFVTLWQCLLVVFGFDPKGIDGSFGSGCKTATNQIFKNKSLPQDYKVDGSDLNKLL